MDCRGNSQKGAAPRTSEACVGCLCGDCPDGESDLSPVVYDRHRCHGIDRVFALAGQTEGRRLTPSPAGGDLAAGLPGRQEGVLG